MVRSAGVILYKLDDGDLRVLIAHMGGPFWSRKDQHAWSIPKGEFTDEEDPRMAAGREFAEEMGSPLPSGELIDLGEVKQSSAKTVHVFAMDADFDASAIRSNTFELEWPRGSGRMQEFPEVDRAEWVDVDTAKVKLVKGQLRILDRLASHLDRAGQSSPYQ